MHYLVTQTKRRIKRQKRGFLLVVLLSLILLSTLMLFKGRTAPRISDDKSLIEQVGRHVLLPDETPTVATVSDVSLLADQPFFSHAKNGDKVLLFRTSNKAILYNPESDRVLEIGNIDSADSEALPE